MTTTIEEQAKAQGWNPNFKGEGAKTAEEFIQKGEEIQAVQADRNKKLLEEVRESNNKITELERNQKEFFEQQFKALRESEEIGYKKAMGEIEKKKLEAVEEGDTVAYKNAVAEGAELKKTKAAKVAPQQKGDDPDFTKWHKENTWYKKNSPDAVSLFADAVGKKMMMEGTSLKGQDFYKAIEKEVKLNFPAISGTKKPAIDDSNHSSVKTSSKGVTYDQLPPEIKKSCDRQCVKMKMKKDKWMELYNKQMG